MLTLKNITAPTSACTPITERLLPQLPAHRPHYHAHLLLFVITTTISTTTDDCGRVIPGRTLSAASAASATSGLLTPSGSPPDPLRTPSGPPPDPLLTPSGVWRDLRGRQAGCGPAPRGAGPPRGVAASRGAAAHRHGRLQVDLKGAVGHKGGGGGVLHPHV
eukprot:1181234-Prorocentrum_minimum.AAC.1